ncbi:MAG: hypothetical protein LUG96_16240 [Tannerellaceae bacterium]|nr:hypothetical protein [Tannerellaceae bacterium]
MPLKLITSDPGENPGRGPFVPDTTLINFESADMQDPGSWYEGSGEKEITIRLKQQTEKPENPEPEEEKK